MGGEPSKIPLHPLKLKGYDKTLYVGVITSFYTTVTFVFLHFFLGWMDNLVIFILISIDRFTMADGLNSKDNYKFISEFHIAKKIEGIIKELEEIKGYYDVKHMDNRLEKWIIFNKKRIEETIKDNPPFDSHGNMECLRLWCREIKKDTGATITTHDLRERLLKEVLP
jgi:hypothetical protein